MLVVLRMNRSFMKFMRTHYMYSDLTKSLMRQHFGCTVVEPEPDQIEGYQPSHEGESARELSNNLLVRSDT